MSETKHKIFHPFKLGDLELKNRFIMAPLTRSRSGEEGLANELMAKYYAQRSGAGLIISEATNIGPYAYGYAYTPGIFTTKQAQSWKKVTEAVHKQNGKIFCQLWHCGRVSHRDLLPDNSRPHSASAIKANAQAFTTEGKKEVSTPKAMSIDEIRSTISDYKESSFLAKEAGFDGVEIHAANGYLLHQFMGNNSNRRDDQYGGTIENRSRLTLDVTKAILEVWDPSRVGIRLSPVSKFNDVSSEDPQRDYSFLISKLDELKLAYIHMIEGHTMETREAEQNIDYKALKKKFRNTYISNNCLTLEMAKELIDKDKTELACFGRKFISNPDLVERFATGAKLNELNQDGLYGGNEEGYTDYPFLS